MTGINLRPAMKPHFFNIAGNNNFHQSTRFTKKIKFTKMPNMGHDDNTFVKRYNKAKKCYSVKLTSVIN